MMRGSVLLTRPQDDSQRIAELLKDEGIGSLLWPLTRIVPVEADGQVLAGVDGLLVTSAHGIRLFADLCDRRDLPVFCVGDNTAGTARDLGFRSVTSSGGDGAALARLAADAPCRHFLYPRGREISHDLAASLTSNGKKVTERIVYDAVPSEDPPARVADALRRGTLSVVTLWSRRGALLFSDWCGRHEVDLQGAQLVAISEQVSKAVKMLQFSDRFIASEPGTDAMVAAIRRAASLRTPD